MGVLACSRPAAHREYAQIFFYPNNIYYIYFITKTNKMKTIKEIVKHFKANPDLELSEKIDMIDNLPALQKKVDALKEYYDDLLDKADIFEDNEDELEDYANGRMSMICEDPDCVSVYDGLYF
jgi:hypothetical protein